MEKNLNNIDSKIIKESLSYKHLSLLEKREANLKDPFLFFYENFLAAYDKNTKVTRGVFYTPESVVSFIIRSLDIIIREKLGVKKGFLDHTIKILDFATGTGTFILALIEFIKNELWGRHEQGLWNNEVNEFILKNIYGFELLVVPYIICHLRIHEYLESYGFHYSGEKERAGIYLTNTLENREIALTKFFQDIDEEIQLSSKIKSNEDILVIMGNPPYSVSSSNRTDFIENLMLAYKEAVRDERNIQPLSDDYIKFIRFAHWKMEKVDKGVIGIITNNSFLDGIIHRGMREELIKTFDEIYILNLHGNSNIGETSHDGSKDENVFDIKQGVSISFFIKTGKSRNLDKGIYYYSLQGLRDSKYDFLYKNEVDKIKWKKLEIKKPDFWFKYKDLSNESNYKTGLFLNDIFINYTSGVKTHDDSNLVYLNTKDINTEKIYYYRPFDFRIINYDLNKVVRHRFKTIYHILNNNIGLIFPRLCKENFFNYGLVSNVLIDVALGGKNSGSETYFAPLYLYTNKNENENLLEEIKEVNFTNTFKQFLKTNELSKKTPETILAYIYSILYSPSYREKYYEFLKIDFPRIPFTKDIKLFENLSDLGQKLIDLHLLKTDFEKSIVSFPVENANFNVETVNYENGKVFINKTTYFDNVPENVWNYYIGGYQVLDKWLKERKRHNYTLTIDDVRHFMKVCDVLNETIKIQEEIDLLTKDWI